MDVMQYKDRKFYSKIDLKNLTLLGLDIIYKNRYFADYYIHLSSRPCAKSVVKVR